LLAGGYGKGVSDTDAFERAGAEYFWLHGSPHGCYTPKCVAGYSQALPQQQVRFGRTPQDDGLMPRIVEFRTIGFRRHLKIFSYEHSERIDGNVSCTSNKFPLDKD
jgi:hypothetical protein